MEEGDAAYRWKREESNLSPGLFSFSSKQHLREEKGSSLTKFLTVENLGPCQGVEKKGLHYVGGGGEKGRREGGELKTFQGAGVG